MGTPLANLASNLSSTGSFPNLNSFFPKEEILTKEEIQIKERIQSKEEILINEEINEEILTEDEILIIKKIRTMNEILTKEEILIKDEILIKEGILTREEIQTRNEIQSKEKILTSKGIYPYDYMDSFMRFKETQLPSKESFYNNLYEEEISDKEYKHAQEIWKIFKIKNLGEYHDLYLKTDVLLLADVFEAFRSLCHNKNCYGLDPAHYFTAPGLAWSAMLKMTEQDIDLISDVDMLLMIEKSKRGGISQVCSKRYAKANNKYLPNYDSEKDSNYLMYFDANNLYGWAMSQSLPYGKLEWVEEKDYEKALMNIVISSQEELNEEEEGYYFEVDLRYPSDLHNKHKDLPFACEKETPKKEWLSDYHKSFNIKGKSTEKLLTTFYDKEGYDLHQRRLKQFLGEGLRGAKIHRVLKFKQSPWMEKYIKFNTDMRANTKVKFEGDFYKLMNNAVFGKTLENVRN